MVALTQTEDAQAVQQRLFEAGVDCAINWDDRPSYLLQGPSGVVVFLPHATGAYQIIIGMAPSGRGLASGVDYIQSAVDWMFANTDAVAILGFMAADNEAVREAAEQTSVHNITTEPDGSRKAVYLRGA